MAVGDVRGAAVVMEMEGRRTVAKVPDVRWAADAAAAGGVLAGGRSGARVVGIGDWRQSRPVERGDVRVERLGAKRWGDWNLRYLD